MSFEFYFSDRSYNFFSGNWWSEGLRKEMYRICKDFSAVWIIVSVVLKSQEKAENHEEGCGIEDFLHIFTQKLCGWTSVFVSHSPLGGITLFMLLLRTWQVLCKNILPSCLKEKLWDTSSALLFQYCFTCLESEAYLRECAGLLLTLNGSQKQLTTCLADEDITT